MAKKQSIKVNMGGNKGGMKPPKGGKGGK